MNSLLNFWRRQAAVVQLWSGRAASIASFTTLHSDASTPIASLYALNTSQQLKTNRCWRSQLRLPRTASANLSPSGIVNNTRLATHHGHPTLDLRHNGEVVPGITHTQLEAFLIAGKCRIHVIRYALWSSERLCSTNTLSRYEVTRERRQSPWRRPLLCTFCRSSV